MKNAQSEPGKENAAERLRRQFPHVRFKKIILHAAALVLFLFATNPTLIPFLPQDVRSGLGETWQSLFGDVDSIAGTLKLNWAALFKLVAMVLMLILLTAVAGFILEHLHPRTGRGRSGQTLLRSAVSYISGLVGIFWGLSIIGVPVGTIFASVGVVALIVGFGAESLVADVVTGIFLVFENQFNVGDIIELDGFRGVVDQIGIRTTYIRDAGNNVKIVNNSDIRNVLNRSSASSCAMVDVSIAYGESIERAEQVLSELLPAVRAKYPEVFLSDPTYLGVQALGESAVSLRVSAEIREGDVYKAPRLLNRELKLGFDRAGIEIPFRQVVVHEAGSGK